MTELHVLRVFHNPEGLYGNPLGVFLDGTAVPAEMRQQVAHDLNFSETVFVDEVADGAARVHIFAPGQELGFAGHPTLGTSWLLRQTGRPVHRLIVPAGDVGNWQAEELAWVRARAEWVHSMNFQQYDDPAVVDAMTEPPPGESSFYAWAWINEPAGTLRSRYFADAIGIVEDEATGAAAVVMGDRIGRPLTIHQGAGSELYARPGPDGTVEIGGRVTLDEVRSV